LSFKEIEVIKSHEFDTDRLSMARDWLVIGCYSGQVQSGIYKPDLGK